MINTVCLCGSTRFIEGFHHVNRELTKRGYSVISISFAAEKDAAGNEKEQHVKELLDLVHFNKILRSDAVVIVGDGYIGFSTAREILWAQMQGKPIFWARSDIDILVSAMRNPSISDETDTWVKRARKKLIEIAQGAA